MRKISLSSTLLTYDLNLSPTWIRRSVSGRSSRALVAEIDRKPRLTMDFFVELNSMLEQKVKYLVRMEPGVQTPEETLEKGSGSCRDNAWLMVNLLRELGFAGRFVSGYLIQLKPDEKSLDAARPGLKSTSLICTPGRRSICRAQDGLGWMAHRGY